MGQLPNRRAYAMARLADDWVEQRQVCVDVLCAYLRMPHVPRLPAVREKLEPTEVSRLAEEDQVRDTVQRLLQTHLHRAAAVSWSECAIDLTGARLHQANFSNARFRARADFTRTHHTGHAEFEAASFAREARFGGASFAGSTGFVRASFAAEAWFVRASFVGYASFEGASFAGDAWFGDASFAGYASFLRASFAGDAWFEAASFAGSASFLGASFAMPPTGLDRSVWNPGTSLP